jgi:hypothetical protein
MSARLAWASWLVSVVLLIASLVLLALARGYTQPGRNGGAVFEAVIAIGLLTFPTVGLVIALRRPDNAIGWLFCAIGIPFALSSAAFAYTSYTLGAGASLPGGRYAAWLSEWLFPPALFGLPTLMFLLFPDGRLLSPRWRPVVWLTGVAIVGLAVPAVQPGIMRDSAVDVANPMGIPGAAGVIDLVSGVSGLAAVLALGLAISSLVRRFRRSRGVERLQLKWFVSASLLFAMGLVAFVALNGRLAIVGQLWVLTAYALIPVSAGVAILRYRLYDIDLVIRRTLVYGALTASLGATYLALVLLIGLAVGHSGFAVAVSTLAVAALFRPLRARIQGVVDRRFYRRRYDAARTLEAFGARLRDELDLETLGSDLRGVVRETVQPAHVSLWLRSEP